LFADPSLAELYDYLYPWAASDDFYLRLAIQRFALGSNGVPKTRSKLEVQQGALCVQRAKSIRFSTEISRALPQRLRALVGVAPK